MKVSAKDSGALGSLICLACFIAIAYGWVMNIVKLAHHTGEFGMLELIRAIGIIAGPLGVVMGYVG